MKTFYDSKLIYQILYKTLKYIGLNDEDSNIRIFKRELAKLPGKFDEIFY